MLYCKYADFFFSEQLFFGAPLNGYVVILVHTAAHLQTFIFSVTLH